MKRKIQLVSLMLAIAMLISLCACGSAGPSDGQAPAEAPEKAAAEAAPEDHPAKDELPAPETPAQDTEELSAGTSDNLIENGDFSGDLLFQLYTESGGEASLSIQNGELVADVTALGSVNHAIQPYYDGFKLTQGVEYELSFDACSTVPRQVYVRIQLNGGDYHPYYEELISLNEEMQHFDSVFTMSEATDPAPRLCVNMGYLDPMRDAGIQPEALGSHQVHFDNFSLVVRDESGAVADVSETDAAGIRVNQVGYLPDQSKTAVFADLSLDCDTFTVVESASGNQVFEGTLSAPADNPSAGETDRVADFTALTQPGIYKIVAADGTESPEFAVSEGVYDQLLKDLVRMLYLQRCGTELTQDGAGAYAHPVCHNTLATVYGTDEKIDVSGGWHDAGDYGRYVVSGAKAAADLLLACECYDGIIDDTGIPESGDGIDDLLQEAKYELDWMMKMQAPSGGVYHKVTCRNFPGFVPPQEETEELIVCPVSNTATGDFAAVMALAGRMFMDSGVNGYAEIGSAYLHAAERAWEYLAAHKGDPGFSNPSDVVTGEYPDGKDRDEYFWAAAELYRAAGNDESLNSGDWLSALSESVSTYDAMSGLGWQDVGAYGVYAVLTNPQISADNQIYQSALNCLRDTAAASLQTIQSNPYGIDRTESFEWGSNLGVANTGVLLLMADRMGAGTEEYSAALRQLDYLLGENPTGYCYVTGTGSKSPQHPHHRPSQAAGAAVPGMLVGGPDSNLEDPFAQSALAGQPPAKCYADSDQSYSTNEVCVYWNSPLILFICGLK